MSTSIKYSFLATFIMVTPIQPMELSLKKIGTGVTIVTTAAGIIYGFKRYQTNKEENKKIKTEEFSHTKNIDTPIYTSPELRGWIKGGISF